MHAQPIDRAGEPRFPFSTTAGTAVPRAWASYFDLLSSPGGVLIGVDNTPSGEYEFALESSGPFLLGSRESGVFSSRAAVFALSAGYRGRAMTGRRASFCDVFTTATTFARKHRSRLLGETTL